MKIKDMDIQELDKDNMEKKKEQKKPSTPLNYSEKRDFDPRPESERIVTEEQKQGFLTKVREVLPNAVVNISFAPPECYDVTYQGYFRVVCLYINLTLKWGQHLTAFLFALVAQRVASSINVHTLSEEKT